MRKQLLSFSLIVALLFSIGAMALSQEVTIAVVWSGAELEAFEKALIPFEQETGIDVVIESVGRDLPAVLVTRLAAGNPPDAAAIPNQALQHSSIWQALMVKYMACSSPLT